MDIESICRTFRTFRIAVHNSGWVAAQPSQELDKLNEEIEAWGPGARCPVKLGRWEPGDFITGRFRGVVHGILNTVISLLVDIGLESGYIDGSIYWFVPSRSHLCAIPRFYPNKLQISCAKAWKCCALLHWPLALSKSGILCHTLRCRASILNHLHYWCTNRI